MWGKVLKKLGQFIGLVVVGVLGITIFFPIAAVFKGISEYFRLVSRLLFSSGEIETARRRYKEWSHRKLTVPENVK